MSGPRLALALCHYPILDPAGQVVTSGITSLDLHDLARCSATYGVVAAYAVTPIQKQRELIEAVIHHWTDGPGLERCPNRGQAFELVQPAGSIEEVIALEAQRGAGEPLVVATSARLAPGVLSYAELRQRLERQSAVLLFGTGRGLAPAAMQRAKVRLAPICGPGEWNHLSVRAAIAIVLDRLRGH